MKKIISGAVLCGLIIGMVFFSGCINNEEGEYEPGIIRKGELSILSHNMTVEYNELLNWYTAKVTGQAKNIGNETFSFASVDVKFYDANGTLLDTGVDSITDLEPNETWSFEILHIDDTEIVAYKIAVGSCW